MDMEIGNASCNVTASFSLLEDMMKELMSLPIGKSAQRAVGELVAKTQRLNDAWETIASIHGLHRNDETEKAKTHSHCGYHPCPLRVIIDGEDIIDGGTNKKNANRLFVNILERIGEDKVAALNLPRFTRNPSVPFITKDRKKLGNSRQIRKTRNGYYVNTNLNNHDKMRFLNRIFKGLNLNASCTIVERQETLF